MVFASDCRTGQFVADGQFLSNRFAAMKMAPETGAIDRKHWWKVARQRAPIRASDAAK
jgi:hypothetical protein